DARVAREAAKLAEERRLAAIQAAAAAAKTAEDTIATKRKTDKNKDPAKIAALPKTHPVSQTSTATPRSHDPRDPTRTITEGGRVTCGRSGCITVPKGCYAVRGAGGGNVGGRVFCQ